MNNLASPSTSTRRGRRGSWLAGAILLLAFVLRVWQLGTRSIWFDEAMEYWVATAALSDLPSAVRTVIQDPPLFSLLLHLWMELGSQEFFLRYLSVVAGVLGVGGIMVLGRGLGGRRAGLVAATIAALLPAEIRYAQEVGQYALMECLLIWSLVALVRWRQQDGWRWGVAWVLLALAATYSYYGTAITLLVTFGLGLIEDIANRNRSRLRADLAALAGFGVGILPLVGYFLPGQLLRGPTSEGLRLGMAHPLTELRDALVATQNLLAFQLSGWPWTPLPAWLSLLLLLAPLVFFAAQSKRSGRARRWLAWLVATWIAFFIVGRLGLFPYRFRYGLILAPLLIPAVATGIDAAWRVRRWRWLAASSLAAILVMSILSLPQPAVWERVHGSMSNAWQWPENEDLRAVVSFWQDQQAAGQPTYIYHGAAPAFGYYAGLAEQSTSPLPPDWFIRCWLDEPWDYCASDHLVFGQRLKYLSAPEKVASVRQDLPQEAAGVWLIFAHVLEAEEQTILEGLNSTYLVADYLRRPGAAAYLLLPR